ncbi:MAG: YceI family protein [Chloroflexota bacterium]
MKNRIQVIGLAAIIVPFLIGCGLQAVEEPSAPIEAVPLELEDEADEAVAEETAVEDEAMEESDAEEMAEEPTAEPVEEPTSEPAEESEEMMEEPTAEPVEEPTAEPVEEPTAEPVEEPTDVPAEEPASEIAIFEIAQESSSVRFELDEDLAGSRITVVGETDQVAGQLAVDYADLSTTQVGVIQVNARTFVTDNEFRNRAINNRILDSSNFEFVTFTPSSVDGLPATIVPGETVEFTMSGSLTIRDVSQDVTFTVSATAVSDTQITGTASTVVLIEDYDIVIPQVPNVANIEEELELYIDFTANAIQ